VHLRVENAGTLFTNRYHQGQVISIPIAHGDGRFTADAETLARIEGEGQVAFRYVDGAGPSARWSAPNGSMNAIAGIVSAQGNVLGMMPHPERAMDPILGSQDGIGVFESVVARVAA
jgi:phosphoribosylformylglycinamidine synthase